jgi:murein L,D-transpeptidase YcbB/YkuD
MKQTMIVLMAACIISSCTQVAGWFGTNKDSTKGEAVDSSSYTAMAPRDESITEANAYSDLFLDSAAIENFIQKEKLNDSVANGLRNFYRTRNYQYAWFTTSGMTEQGKEVWNLHAEDSINANKKLEEHMDSLVQNDSLTISKGDTSYLQSELSLTKNLLGYAQKSGNGLITASNLYYLVPAKKQDALQLADSILNKQKDSALYAGNKAYGLLKQQLAVYYKAVKDSNWQSISPGTLKLKRGSKSPLVTALKKRMQATNDYTASDTSALFNDSLELAIKNYQQRNGLAPTGKVNDSLVEVLNVPAEQRVKQILVNMNRMLWMQPMMDSNRLVINIPSLMLYAYEDSGKAFEMPVIVGKEGTGTLMFSGNINQIVFNPTWKIPKSITEKEIMPKMQADPNYLKKNNMEIISKNDSVPTIYQKPYKTNPLGKAKFIFPNNYDIYLHDTPDKTLFTQPDRALSHGCIRVADAEKLAQYLLRNQNDWSKEKIHSAMNSGKEQTVTVKTTEPVYITYHTAWVDEKGQLSFRNDVYGHDKETMDRMFK